MPEQGIPKLNYDSHGLIPVIVQDYRTNEVLMLAYSNEEAVREMLETGHTCFWSRSRKQLWRKGETSGNTQRIVSIQADCDADSLLVRVEQKGVACHTGAPSCFFDRIYGDVDGTAQILPDLLRVIEDRKKNPRGDSYTCKLFGDQSKMCKKLIEEAAEVALAVKDGDESGKAAEMADLVYHALVVMVGEKIPFEDVYEELSSRRE